MRIHICPVNIALFNQFIVFFCPNIEMKDTETFLLAYFMTNAGTFMTFYVTHRDI